MSVNQLTGFPLSETLATSGFKCNNRNYCVQYVILFFAFRKKMVLILAACFFLINLDNSCALSLSSSLQKLFPVVTADGITGPKIHIWQQWLIDPFSLGSPKYHPFYRLGMKILHYEHHCLCLEQTCSKPFPNSISYHKTCQ